MSLPFESVLSQCMRHAVVMESALAAMPQRLTVADSTHASPETVRFIDQFVLRFIRLQDTLGAYMLRQFVLAVLREPMEETALVDVLNLQERRGFMDASQLAVQRNLRNALTHEYPDDPARQAAVLVGWLSQI